MAQTEFRAPPKTRSVPCQGWPWCLSLGGCVPTVHASSQILKPNPHPEDGGSASAGDGVSLNSGKCIRPCLSVLENPASMLDMSQTGFHPDPITNIRSSAPDDNRFRFNDLQNIEDSPDRSPFDLLCAITITSKTVVQTDRRY